MAPDQVQREALAGSTVPEQRGPHPLVAFARPRRRRWILIALGVIVVVAGAIGFTAWQATHVRSSLEDTAAELQAMTDDVARGDLESAQEHLDQAHESAASAHLHSRGPIWWTAGKLPEIGDDVTAVRTVAEVSDDLTSNALPDILVAGSQLTNAALQPTSGLINLAPIRDAAPLLRAGADEIAQNADRVSRLETSGLMPSLRGPVQELRDKLTEGEGLTQSAAIAATVMPQMLGEDGRRAYLVLFQNNAEMRSTGGMPGSMALMTAREGQLRLVKTVLPRNINDGYFPTAVVPTTPSQLELFGGDAVQRPQYAGVDPDFPRSAQVLRAMWEQANGQRIDGVMSIDPVVLAGLLTATGAVEVEGRVLSSENAVETLLNETYLELPTDEAQNELFKSTLRAVLGKIMNSHFDPADLVRALDAGVEERRVFVWSAYASEQDVFAPLRIGGAVPTQATDTPEVGLYVTDAASDKLTYYLDHTVDVDPRRCDLDGRQVMHVETTLKSNVPVEADLPDGIVGGGSGEPGLPPGDMRLTTYLYAPVGGQIDDATLDGTSVEWAESVDEGRPVGKVTVEVPRGAERILDYTVTTERGQTADPHLLTTPGVRSDGIGDVGDSACS